MKMGQRVLVIVVVFVGFVCLNLRLPAQTVGNKVEHKVAEDVFFKQVPEGGPARHMMYVNQMTMGGPMDFTFRFVSSEMGFDGKVIKGAPYSAETVTEMTQTLGDGNRIVRKTTGAVARDSEGRTRREQTLGAIGPWVAPEEPPQTIFIHDPVAGVSYLLEPSTRTARKLPVHQMGARSGAAVGIGSGSGEPIPPPGMQVGVRQFLPQGDVKHESLGKQMIEGVEAEGTRDTITIPAGKIGNELPIQIVSERWSSADLQVVVMTKHSDPRFGDTVYRLTNITRSDPARSLFEVPADYTVKENEGPVYIRKRHVGGGNPSSN